MTDSVSAASRVGVRCDDSLRVGADTRLEEKAIPDALTTNLEHVEPACIGESSFTAASSGQRNVRLVVVRDSRESLVGPVGLGLFDSVRVAMDEVPPDRSFPDRFAA